MKIEIIVLQSMNLEKLEFIFEEIHDYIQGKPDFVLSYGDNLSK